MKSKTHILIAFILNFVFAIVEFIGGILTNSVSILSDSVHDIGDSISLAIAYFLEKKADKKADKEFTYGYARYSVIGGFITSTILLFGSFVVLINAVARLGNPEVVNYRGMFILGILGITVNLIGTIITSKGKRVNEKAVSLHLLEDVLTWISVLFVSVVIKFTELYILDPILSIVISLFVMTHVYKHFTEILEIFLEKKPKNIDVDLVINEIKKIKEVKNIHHMHIWSLDGVNTMLTMHVSLKEDMLVSNAHVIIHEIKHRLEHLGINHSTIELEHGKKTCNEKECKINIETEHHHHHH